MRSFKSWGRVGGLKRAKRLSATARKAIASKAANARWKHLKPISLLPSVRLSETCLEDPVYLEEILSEGSLNQWGTIYQKIADQPFGPTAQALGRVLQSTNIYGVTPLWKGILNTLRGTCR